MRRSHSSSTIVAGLVALLTAPVGAAGQAGEGAEVLLLPVGARTVGMGGAVTGARGTPEAVIWSPAGVAGLVEKRLWFNHYEGAFDTRSDVLAPLWPTR